MVLTERLLSDRFITIWSPGVAQWVQQNEFVEWAEFDAVDITDSDLEAVDLLLRTENINLEERDEVGL